MNLRDLDYIRAVARHAHFGKAADACQISQPALSTQVKKLEAELGVTLFERDNRSVRLTDIGGRIVALADEALSVVDNIRLTAANAQEPFSGEFVLGSIPTITPYLVPHFLGEGKSALPNLTMQFHEDITERLSNALIDGNIDAAILATPADHPKLDSIDLYDEPFWVIYPRGHALDECRSIGARDLPCDELLLLSEGHCFREQTLDVFELATAPATRSVRATSLETLINMVAVGHGVTLVPAMAIAAHWSTDERLLMAPLDDARAYRRANLTFRRNDPRRELFDRIATLIVDNLPDSVSAIRKGHTATG